MNRYSSNLHATRYTTQTRSVSSRPTGDCSLMARPRKLSTDPSYIGDDVMLYGKAVTLSFIKIPK